MEETWDEIFRAAIAKAQAVKCSIPEYIEGLKQMIDSIQEEIDAADEYNESH